MLPDLLASLAQSFMRCRAFSTSFNVEKPTHTGPVRRPGRYPVLGRIGTGTWLVPSPIGGTKTWPVPKPGWYPDLARTQT